MTETCPFCDKPIEPEKIEGFPPIYLCYRDRCPSVQAELLLVDNPNRESPKTLERLKAFAARSDVHAEALREALEGEVALAPLREYLRIRKSAAVENGDP